MQSMTIFNPALACEAFEDDREGLVEFLRSVSATMRSRYDDVRAATESGDASALRSAAHALKGSSGHLGSETVSAIAGRIELEARAGRIEPEATFAQLATA
ncbi:MAG: Hpt domain-containing protein, partial [Candidatus Eremiobacteraeota bacterium]|nr:Hpt domain-containing protein [Candidatus Eremiobacteraeota bacterium]